MYIATLHAAKCMDRVATKATLMQIVLMHHIIIAFILSGSIVLLLMDEHRSH